MTTYCCVCKWARDGGGFGGTEEMRCDHKTLSKSFVTGKRGAVKCSEINKDGNCLGFEMYKSRQEIISETDSNKSGKEEKKSVDMGGVSIKPADS